MTNNIQSANEDDSRDKLPTPENFFLDIPLYRSFNFEHAGIEGPEADLILRVEFFDGSIKTLCIECGEESVFRTDRLQSGELDRDYRQVHGVSLVEPGGCTAMRTTLLEMLHTGNNGKEYALKNRFFLVEFYCTSNHRHRLCFSFAVHNRIFTKIGQYPSISDLGSQVIKKYRRVLGSSKSAEFTRAINLYSHDIGIGAFVYLRRIFEHFIEEAHKGALASGAWKDEEYEKKRFDERIESLREYLPGVLVENRAIYAILSKGLHELSEEECLDYFPVTRAGIELILEEKRLQAERELKRKEITKEIGKIKGELSSE